MSRAPRRLGTASRLRDLTQKAGCRGSGRLVHTHVPAGRGLGSHTFRSYLTRLNCAAVPHTRCRNLTAHFSCSSVEQKGSELPGLAVLATVVPRGGTGSRGSIAVAQKPLPRSRSPEEAFLLTTHIFPLTNCLSTAKVVSSSGGYPLPNLRHESAGSETLRVRAAFLCREPRVHQRTQGLGKSFDSLLVH